MRARLFLTDDQDILRPVNWHEFVLKTNYKYNKIFPCLPPDGLFWPLPRNRRLHCGPFQDRGPEIQQKQLHNSNTPPTIATNINVIKAYNPSGPSFGSSSPLNCRLCCKGGLCISRIVFLILFCKTIALFLFEMKSSVQKYLCRLATWVVLKAALRWCLRSRQAPKTASGSTEGPVFGWRTELKGARHLLSRLPI